MAVVSRLENDYHCQPSRTRGPAAEFRTAAADITIAGRMILWRPSLPLNDSKIAFEHIYYFNERYTILRR